ncbi:Histidine--tRNA ligase [Rickettsiales bacterium Ac37b]|nr:Histidine--tRNA ligase [Rickettsiales bacterium Ac37b]
MAKINSISGFPEFLPNDQIIFNKTLELIKNYFEKSGFMPLDTPAVERITTLTAKGIESHEIYGIYRLAGNEGDNKKDLALRFDLTVPLARYVAQHYDKLIFPYRRYHIAPVWRGERAQAGRYRQFYQCDIDVIGDGELSIIHDAELPVIIFQIFKALNIGKFTIRINNRNILRGLLFSLNLESGEIIKEVLRIIDKIEKISTNNFKSELIKLGLSEKKIEFLLEFINKKLSNSEWINYLKTPKVNEEFSKGVDELEQVIGYMRILGIEEEYFAIDPTIARGLDYYTGTIYETRLEEYPELGSICSGGRYANLAENFTNKELPGVGLSIGISRLIPKLIEVGILENKVSTVAPVIITTQNQNRIKGYLEIASLLRTADIYTEIYLQPKNLAAQMKYAGKKGFLLAVIADELELDENRVVIRNLLTGIQVSTSKSNLVENIKNMLKEMQVKN